MPDRVLIDTSVWIDYFRAPRGVVFDRISSLLRNKQACYTGIVALELIRGAKTQKELSVLDTLFGSIHRLTETETTHKEAGLLGFRLARKGAILGTVDLLIAQLAIENSITLFSHDRHFQAILKVAPLKLYGG